MLEISSAISGDVVATFEGLKGAAEGSGFGLSLLEIPEIWSLFWLGVWLKSLVWLKKYNLGDRSFCETVLGSLPKLPKLVFI